VVVSAGETGYYKFINYNSGGTNTYENWYLWAAKYGTTENIMALRADKAANIGSGTFNEDFSTENLAADLNGATVELFTNLIDAGDGLYTLKVTAVTTKADGTIRTPNYEYTQTNIETDKVNLFVSVEKCWLGILEQKSYPTSVTKTISDAGWATYCSPYALDLANATGLTDAYIVTGGENSVLAKTSVKGGTVPANTGLLLKGPAGTATIPVVPSGDASNVTGNKLVGVTAETPIDPEAGYVLLKENNVLGFYKNTNAFTLGANTAYLPVSFDQNGAARASYLLFDDMTGISQVAGSKVKTNGAIYNLNGQRVSNPTKGIYIIDGVKVAIE